MNRLRSLVPLAVAAALCASVALAQDARYPNTDDQRQWNQPFEPLRIVGNVYYVGTADLASYLITTSAGHILLDAGLEESGAQILASVSSLGFSPRDIKVLLNTQAHFDHAAGLAAIKKFTGARLLASAADAAMLERGGRDDFAFGDELPFAPVTVDAHVADGEPVSLGEVTLTPRLTPGHTKGTTSWIMTVNEGGRPLTVLFVGSTSVNPGVPLVGNTKYPEIAKDLSRTFTTLKSLRPDVFLSQHGGFFGLKEKAARARAGAAVNPFIDPAGYVRAIEAAEKRVADLK